MVMVHSSVMKVGIFLITFEASLFVSSICVMPAGRGILPHNSRRFQNNSQFYLNSMLKAKGRSLVSPLRRNNVVKQCFIKEAQRKENTGKPNAVCRKRQPREENHYDFILLFLSLVFLLLAFVSIFSNNQFLYAH